VYSDFYEIPLPALRFEKVEETDTKKWKRHRRETTLKEKQNHSLNEAKRKNDANDAQRKADSLARKRHAKQTQARFQTEELAIREIKLTQNKNGRY
jgi:hypothetical protein